MIPGPGQAVLFGTTELFLERMGLGSLHDLPPIADFVPGAEVVEALEHGLRLSADDEPLDEPSGGDVAADGGVASAGSGPMLDLDDPS